ncbi:MAG: AAA family ATPase [Phycisphaeraceae bacterium]|nr:AAA family ATPase [Phycisphaerales bacterium]MCB9860849.1 AAA family ATPase [Phycisphaeraceae bacterium]
MTVQALYPDSILNDPVDSTQHSRSTNTKRLKAHSSLELAIEEQRYAGFPVSTWKYFDDQRTLVGAVVRFEHESSKKTYRPFYRNSEGLWETRAIPPKRPMYRLPEVLNLDVDKTVYVCEGEKAVDAAVSCGLEAVTSAGGSNASKHTDWSPLNGRDVVVLPDNDPQGSKYARDVVMYLKGAGARSVRILDLSQVFGPLEPHDDIADIAKRIDRQTVRDTVQLHLASNPTVGERISRCEISTTCMDSVTPRSMSWLWKDRVILGGVTLLVGKPGDGKSFATADIAARVSTGRDWPDGTSCPQGDVVFILGEDPIDSVLVPRLSAQSAELSRVHVLEGTLEYTPQGDSQVSMFSLDSLDALEEQLDRLPNAKLVILDPVGTFLGTEVDAYRDNEVRSVLGPLQKLAERREIAVVLVAHQRKSMATHADDLVLGSRAFTGLARSVLHLVRDHDDNERRLLLHGKNNYAKSQGGLAFRLDEADPPTLIWDSGLVEMTANEYLASRPVDSEERSEQDAVNEWLWDLVQSGVRLRDEVGKRAKAAGITARRITKAIKQLRLVNKPGGVGKPWVLSLPVEET